jgi:hypothetical protein
VPPTIVATRQRRQPLNLRILSAPNVVNGNRHPSPLVASSRSGVRFPLAPQRLSRSGHAGHNVAIGHWLGAPTNRLADCGLISTNAAAVRAQELSNRPTDDDHEH